MNVVMVIPSQGESVNAFKASAQKLKRVLYHRAKIVQTTVIPIPQVPPASGVSLSVAFTTLDGHAFTWDTAHDLHRVLTISHAFSGDGPNLSYHAGGFQPWGSIGDSLSPEGLAFWISVGVALRSDGKIILLGCFMGGGSYAGNVARATGKLVYASTSLFAAGNEDTAVKYVRAIEAGRTPSPLKEFAP